MTFFESGTLPFKKAQAKCSPEKFTLSNNKQLKAEGNISGLST
jgi:hypothetical protein